MRVLMLFLLFCSSLYGKEIWILSIPNSGTHIIQRALKLLEVGDIPYMHPTSASWDFRSVEKFLEQHPHATIIYNIRDPRDNIVAFHNSFWRQPMQLRNQGIWGGELAFSAVNFPQWEHMTHDERLLAAITGGPLNALQTYRCIDGGMNALIKHMHLPQLHLFRYEEMIGPKGGGSLEAQTAAITRLCEVAGGNPDKIQETVETLYLGSKGMGRWRKEMKPEHIQAFKKSVFNRWLLYWGYEKNSNWN